jgi:uncharacterized membrane protein
MQMPSTNRPDTPPLVRRDDSFVPWTDGRKQTNVGTPERIVSTLLGGALLLGAIRRPSPAGAALAVGGSALMHRGVTGHCMVYSALGRGSAEQDEHATEHSITIERPAAEIHRTFRDPEHLAAMLSDVAEVTDLGQGRLRWLVKLPVGKPLQWTTRTVEDVPGERIAWQSEPDAAFSHRGAVRFQAAPRDWGTVVTLSLGFSSGPLALMARSFRERLPRALEEHVLRRCKSLCVAGEIPTLRRNPSARERPSRSKSQPYRALRAS